MAIWQFKFFIIPKKNLLKEHEEIPNYLEEYKPRHYTDEYCEDQEFINYWNGVDMPDNEFNLIQIESWDDEAKMYGEKDGNKIEIWKDEFICFIDARKPNFKLLNSLIIIAKSLKCMIVLGESGKLIKPDIIDIRKYFNNSTANKFVLNQENTLISLKKNKIKLIQNDKKVKN